MDEEDFFNSPLYKSTRINRDLREKLDHVRDSREKTVRRDELTVKSLVFEFPAAEKTIGFRDDLSSSSPALVCLISFANLFRVLSSAICQSETGSFNLREFASNFQVVGTPKKDPRRIILYFGEYHF